MIYICPSDDYDDLQRDWYYVSWPGFNAYQSQEAIRLIGEGVGGLVIIYFYVFTREIGSCCTTKMDLDLVTIRTPTCRTSPHSEFSAVGGFSKQEEWLGK